MSYQCNDPNCQNYSGTCANDAAPEASERITLTSGFLTSEFWASIGTVAVNVMAVLMVVNKIPVADAETLTTAVSSLVAGLGAVVMNGAVIWRYIASRAQVKSSAAEQQTQRMANRLAVRVESMRLREDTARLRMGLTQRPQEERQSVPGATL